jgi:hypothetical protein
MSDALGRQYSLLRCAGWVCAWIAWAIVIVADMFSWFGCYEGLVMAVAIPVVGIPMVLAAYSAMAFPLPYSVFGRLERTPLPKTEPVLVMHGSWGAVGGLHSTVPFVSWLIYPMGIGIRLWGSGAVFLPLAAITSVQYGFLGQCVISHSWHELRSPVKGPAEIGKMIEAGLGKQVGQHYRG